MAPEILLEQRYARAVDWWAFGFLTYEVLLGQSPFRGDDEDEIFDAIFEDEPLYPITMPSDAVSILEKDHQKAMRHHCGIGQLHLAHRSSSDYANALFHIHTPFKYVTSHQLIILLLVSEGIFSNESMGGI
ncbi:hypothetical protein F5877DRAFT_73650 [Lentinula edodes]|nr:hypothetical protein F5877DRAFT_73650 [Lentinula edodes]